MTFTYIKNENSYMDDLHTCWMHLFQHLDTLKVTKVKEDESAVEFVAMSEEAARVVQFLIDCDFGLVMTEEHRREYEEDNGPVF